MLVQGYGWMVRLEVYDVHRVEACPCKGAVRAVQRSKNVLKELAVDQ